MPLITTPHLDDADGFYEALIECHHGLEEAQSHALNARLVLLLANHIGDAAVLQEALNAARRSAGETASMLPETSPDHALRSPA